MAVPTGLVQAQEASPAPLDGDVWTWTSANDINDAGQIVGTITEQPLINGTPDPESSSIVNRPVLWESGQMLDLGTWPGDLGSTARGSDDAASLNAMDPA